MKKITIFDICNALLLTALAFTAVYPLIYVLSASLSAPQHLFAGEVWFLPKGINLAAYKDVLVNNEIWMAYGNSIFYTVVGTLISVILTISGAYPISKKRFQGRKVFTIFFALTMWFNAGMVMIPNYLNMQDLHLYNTRFAVLLILACSAFYIILMKTNFEGIPESLEEAAIIDGASDFAVLTKIFLPLSKPSIATISLFYLVGRWNAYLWPMILLKDLDKMPLQVLLKRLTIDVGMSEYASAVDMSAPVSQETVVYTTIIVAIIPMLVVYPFIQKYFEKGIMIGAIKG